MIAIPTPLGAPRPTYKISWDVLPDDYLLPDEPVDNTCQPILAAALRESLELIGFVTPERLIATNLGVCASVNGKLIVKAPDWLYVPQVFTVNSSYTRRSYTPLTEGAVPAIVMEFLSETDGGEYSARPFHPYGKLWFYERILQVPIYVIFEPDEGMLEVRHLVDHAYQLQDPDQNGRYWIDAMHLYLGRWQGSKADRSGYWLRWWDQDGNLLLWGSEQLAQERQRTEHEHQRAERLAELLRSQGIDPDAMP